MKPGSLDSLNKEDSKTSWVDKKNKVMEMTSTIKKSMDDDTKVKFYAIASYLPFLGPIVVFAFKKPNKLLKLHTKNAIYTQLSFFSIWLCIWLAENLPIVSSFLKIILFVPFVTNAVMYVNVFIFLVVSCVGVWNANQQKLWVTPYLHKFLDEKIFKRVNDFQKKKDINPEEPPSKKEPTK